MDFILWPRNDIEKIVCLLFSRWKESDEPFRPVQVFCSKYSSEHFGDSTYDWHYIVVFGNMLLIAHESFLSF